MPMTTSPTATPLTPSPNPSPYPHPNPSPNPNPNQAEYYLTDGYTEYIELRIPEPIYVVPNP